MKCIGTLSVLKQSKKRTDTAAIKGFEYQGDINLQLIKINMAQKS